MRKVHSEEVVQTAGYLWHQESEGGQPLLSATEIAVVLEITCNSMSSLAFRNGFRKRAPNGSLPPVWAEDDGARRDKEFLRAAAPDLLAVCEVYAAPLGDFRNESLQGMADYGHQWAKDLLQLRAAIRKAKEG